MAFTHTPAAPATHTSRQADVWIAPAALVRMFGEPAEGDGYKISGQYVFVGADGGVARVYDWKATSLYEEEGGVSPGAFWATTRRVHFNVGAHDRATAARLVSWLCARGARTNAWGL